MANSKPILRRCVSCNSQNDKREMIRLVKAKENSYLEIDLTGKKNGRGAYICKNEECLKKVIKSKKLERTFEIKIDDDFYEELRGIIIG